MTSDISEQAEAFARLAQELHGEHGITETAEAVARFARETVGCGYAGLLLAEPDGVLRTVAVTDPLIELSDQLQLDADHGPAYSLIAEGHDLLLVSDSLAEPRWRGWTTGIAQLGLRSMLAVGLELKGGAFGVLQLFDRQREAFSTEDAEVAYILARHAAVAVASAQQEASLWREADARKQVGQAQGILMERLAIDAQEAFAVLRRFSQENNVKLRDVARLLAEDRKLPSDGR